MIEWPTASSPQIAKADGDGPGQDYVAAMPGWTRDASGERRLRGSPSVAKPRRQLW